MTLTQDRWSSTDEYFAAFTGVDDLRGRMSAIDLPLIRRARPRLLHIGDEQRADTACRFWALRPGGA